MELQPGNPQGRLGYAVYLMQAGRVDEALGVVLEARNFDPLSLFVNVFVGWFNYYARHYEEAIKESRAVAELAPDFFEPYIVMGLAYEQKGMYKEAVAAFEAARSKSEDNPLVLGVLGGSYARCGRKADAEGVLDRLDALTKIRYVAPMSFAMLHAGQGDVDKVMEWLQRACDLRDGQMGYLGVLAMYDPFRKDPRFAALLGKIGLAHDKTAEQPTQTQYFGR